MTYRAAWANTWHQHLTEQAVGDPIVVAVLDLHRPDEHGDCSGCESDGWEAEQPEYGCATVRLIADTFGQVLQLACPVCGSFQRALTAGGPSGHHRRDGDMWVSCPGSTETVETMPWRSEVDLLDGVYAQMTGGLGTAIASCLRVCRG